MVLYNSHRVLMGQKEIDFNEKLMLIEHPDIIDVLLSDRSSKKNIKWCTDNYSRVGIHSGDFMVKESIIFRKESLIRPRILKSQVEQKKRIKDMAEVFTPSWVCNKQNNIVDNAWFGYEGSFNKEINEGWVTTEEVIFPEGKKWEDYVELERLEITCGEAPYLVSRYDATTGDFVETKDRIGLLDRKLRVISENVKDKEKWIEWAKIAYQRVYGFEWQGDSLLIARENLLLTFIDFFENQFGEKPSFDLLIIFADIISWNIWQMDGLKFVIPDSCHKEEILQISLFEDMQEEPEFCYGCKSGDNHRHNGVYCKIKDWKTNKILRFLDIVDGGMKYAKC